MKTVIANDRIGRFAELDHTVLEEVRVIMEAPVADDDDKGGHGPTARTLDWLRAALQKAVGPARSS